MDEVAKSLLSFLYTLYIVGKIHITPQTAESMFRDFSKTGWTIFSCIDQEEEIEGLTFIHNATQFEFTRAVSTGTDLVRTMFDDLTDLISQKEV